MSKDKLRKIFLVPVFVFILLASFLRVGMFVGIENFLEDRFFSEREVSPDLAIIAIDDESINKIGQWPWPRETIARLFENLEKFQPEVVGLDVVFSEPSRIGVVDDNALRDTLKKINYPVVFPMEAKVLKIGNIPELQGLIKPLFENSSSSLLSFGDVNLILDQDGIARRTPFFAKDAASGKIITAFAFEAVKKSGQQIPDEENIQSVERIVFARPPGGLQKIPAWRVYENEGNNIPKNLLAGKIIFIGATASDLHDEKPTPFSKGTQMSGVEIQAQIADMLLQGYRLRDTQTGLLLLWIFSAAFASAAIFYLVQRVWLAIMLSTILGLAYTPMMIMLFDAGIVANFTYINLAWILSSVGAFSFKYFVLEKEKREMRGVFSKYVSKDVLEEILKDVSKVKLGGEEKQATVFFSDVRSFTTLSEKLTPAELTAFLNRYLTRMTDIMLANRGVVDKYIGDAIMGFWGAPITTTDHATRAVETSVEMIEALRIFNEESLSRGENVIDIGIGLNSGMVVAGNMGSTQRFDYTVMGDTVNLASRLESQTKNYGVKILVSENTFNSLDKEKIVTAGILIREIDKIKVKGKNLPVTIFEVVGRAKQAEVGGIIDNFNLARELYYEGKWDECLALAEVILQKIHDGPTKILMDRCLYFKEHEPEKWDGVYEMKTK